MELAYVAHSERCALLLDADGVCRWVIPKVDATDATVAAARRCIGAQFVATLDHDAPGFMGHEPRVGANLLFALVSDGRVSLVRFGPLQHFEELDADDKASAETIAPPPAPAAEPEQAAATANEDEPLPPTVADVPDVDDLITSLATDSTPDLDVSQDTAEAAPEPELELTPLADEAEPASAEAAPVATEAESADADATPIAPDVEVTPPSLDANGDIEIVTGSFARASVRAIELDAREDEPSDLDALDALIGAAKAPMSQATADPIDRPLDGIVALTSARPEGGKGPDDSQLEIATTAFARSEELAALLESDLDVDVVLDTGSFARASSRDVDVAEEAPSEEGSPADATGSDPFMAETERVPRPSGFVKKQPPAGEAAPDEHALASDDETRRFSRASGDLPFVELDPEPESPRRGMLPRRG